MARSVTTAKQSADALLHFAQFFEDHAASLRAAAALLQADPPVESVEVKHETSRNVGMEYVTNWVNAAKQAAFDARLSAYQTGQAGGIRKSDTKSPKR
jgi:hypothetical protein